MVSVCYTVKMAAGKNKDKSESFSQKKTKKKKNPDAVNPMNPQ